MSAGERLNNRFDSQPSICVCFSACFYTLAGVFDKRGHYTAHSMAFFCFLKKKGTGRVILIAVTSLALN